MTLRLPEEKLKALILGWLGKKVTVARDLKSLGGKLEHACRVVRPGRSFMRRMLDLLSGVKFSHRHIRLSASFHSDLMWWHLFPVIMELMEYRWSGRKPGCNRMLWSTQMRQARWVVQHGGARGGSSTNGLQNCLKTQ